MYALPQEIEVWYVIPAVRKEMAKVLVKKYKFSYEKTGEILGVSKAAISQYLTKKRAQKVVFDIKIKKEIERSCQAIYKDEKKALREILRVLNLIKKNKELCRICRKFNKGIISKCNSKPYI